MGGVWLVVTASSAAQARGYRRQLDARQATLEQLGIEHAQVIADPGDKRVGSGGSTLWVLHQIAGQLLKQRPDARSLSALFADQRILIVHSGGDSKRLCCYAAQGKAFTPLPCGKTLFDLILEGLVKLPCPPRGQVLIAAGDVLLTFDPAAVDFDRPGIVGVAYPAPIDRGSKHGVYVTANGSGDRVADFLQKPTEAHARQRGAIDAVGRVLVDTGLISLDPDTTARWLAMAGLTMRGRTLRVGPGILRELSGEAGQAPNLDLYEQMLMAVPRQMTRARYLDAMGASKTRQGTADADRQRLEAIHAAMHRTPFHVSVLPYCDFFHIGSSRELLANVTTLGRTAQTYGFANFDRAVVRDRAATEGAFVFNSLIDSPSVRAGQGVLIEASHLRGAARLPGGNIVVGYPEKATGTLSLARDEGLVCLPIRGKGERWAAVRFGMDDDCKTPRNAGGTLLNHPLDALVERHGLKPAEVWGRLDAAAHTLWDAKLWVVGPINDAIRHGAWLSGASRKSDAKVLSAWRKAKRYSLRQLIGMVDHDRLLEHRRQIQRRVGLATLGKALSQQRDLPAAAVLEMIQSADDAVLALRQAQAAAEAASEPLDRARLLRVCVAIAQAHPRAGGSKVVPMATRGAFYAVAESVRREIVLPTEPPRAAILPDQVVWVTTPVRIDFAGGWSDTPPICADRGGSVVNAAVTLNGQYPVQVMAKLAAEPTITLNSIDLGKRVVLRDADAFAGAIDARQWHALPIAALRLSGLLPSDPRRSLRRHLEAFGGGLEVTLFSALPKGSGMGTSSILGAAMLACLGRVTGRPLEQEELIVRTSLLEQVMGTGGGWQDQVGGVTGGTKLIRTAPGADQRPSIHWCAFSLTDDAELRSRCLLYFTGIQRMARDILHNVVMRYLSRDPVLLGLVDRLKDEAQQLKRALDSGDRGALARGVEEYWRLKRAIDPGSTNPRIEALLRPINRYLEARLLPGAGGGGFVFMIARDADAARRVRQTLDAQPPNGAARFFDFQIDPKGLSITTL